jgi:hypothetical protein
VSLAKQHIPTAKRDDGSGVGINASYDPHEASGSLTDLVAGLEAPRYKESESADISLSKMDGLQS